MKITQNVRDYANNLTNSDSEVEEGLKAMKEVYQEQSVNIQKHLPSYDSQLG